MKAVVCSEFGPIEQLAFQDVPDPVPGDGEVLIDIMAAAVNFPDGLIVRGEYQIKPPPPFIPGSEVSGTVVAMGAGVKGVKIGDRVAALCLLGGFAEKVAVSVDEIMPIPERMTWDEAAGATLTYGTALHALRRKAGLKEGDTLLVLGAAGGVGIAAVQVGKAIGARVIAAASSGAKLEAARTCGADELVDYSNTDLKSELRRIAPKGINVVIDPVGGALTEAAVRNLAWGGKLLVVGFAAGEIAKLPPNLLLLKEAAAIGVNWGEAIRRHPEARRDDVRQLSAWFDQGVIRPHVGREFFLPDFKDALEEVMNRRAVGKIVLKKG